VAGTRWDVGSYILGIVEDRLVIVFAKDDIDFEIKFLFYFSRAHILVRRLS
jgi:hypothetical protein